MGRYHIALTLATSPDLQKYFDYDWALIGNLGVDLFVFALGRVMGVEAATKLVVLATPLIMGAGFLWTAAQVHGRIPPTALLALVFTYAYPFHYGFVNYCLAVAFAVVAFSLWIKLQGRAYALRAAVFAAAASMIWISHAVGWVLLCVLCGSYELWWQWGRRTTWFETLRRTAGNVLPLLAPVILMALAPRGAPLELTGWFDVQSLAKWVLALNRDRWLVYDIACTLTIIAILALAVFHRFGLSFNPALAFPALALFAVYILAPDSINGSAFVSARIIPYAAAYALLAIDMERVGTTALRRWTLFCAAFVAVRMAATTVSFFLYSASYDRSLQALRHVERGAAVAVFERQFCQPTLANWGNARLQHLGGLAIVRRNAFVNDQWNAEALQLLTVRYAAAGRFTNSPSEVVTLMNCQHDYPSYLPDALNQLPRSAFDYVWLFNIPPDERPRRPWLRLVHASPESALYAIEPAGSAS